MGSVLNTRRASILLFALGIAGGVIAFIAWWTLSPTQQINDASRLVALVAPMSERGDKLAQAEAADRRHDYDAELNLLQPLAERGDPEAEERLGILYLAGHGVFKNVEEGARWERKAAQQGNADAQLELGFMYRDGWGVPKDPAEAVRWMGKAATQWRTAAGGGDASAQGKLGGLYECGCGVAKDEKQAIIWYQKAAEHGDSAAQNRLGIMYEYGLNLPVSFAEALDWFHKAAEQGNAEARRNIGSMYDLGEGTGKNPAEAFRWYYAAASQGDTDAMRDVGNAYAWGDGVPKDEAKALDWYRRAANVGDVDAQIVLGDVYARRNTLSDLADLGDMEKGVPLDYAQALQWYRKAAEQDNPFAQTSLASMFYQGLGISRNYKAAAEWFLKAAKIDSVAQAMIALMYHDGLGVPRDYIQAIYWFREAAYRGAPPESTIAQYDLGLMYTNGEGVPRDYIQAYVWLNLAAAHGEKDAAKIRNRLERSMTLDQINRAQQLTAGWRHIQSWEHTPPAPQATNEDRASKFGTGFVIAISDEWKTRRSKDALAAGHSAAAIAEAWRFVGAYVITNAHVVAGCSRATIGSGGGRHTAQVVARDTQNDLALLHTSQEAGGSALRLLVRQGEPVVAYGYPLPGLLASGGNSTTGNVTALSGLGDDARFLQISTPVQPGNSGGPLIDEYGNVVGVVEGKLDAIKVASATGDIPQNVNFAIKGSVVASFLEKNHVHFATGHENNILSPADLVEQAKRFTVPLECDSSAR